MTKQELLRQISQISLTNATNRMGVSENFYNPEYLISQAFEKEILEALTDREAELLYQLAEFAGEAFY
jgi:hypothetical protein